MANTFAPFGFSQWKGTGSTPTFEMFERLIAFGNATAIYSGDPLVSLNTGYVTQATAGTTQIAGIFAGCSYLSVSMKRRVWMPYWPGSDASTDVVAYIINDPNAQFKVQAGGSATTSPITQANVGNNVNFGVGTGNTLSGLSGAYIDQTTVNTTNTLPFRILQLLTDPPGGNGTDSTTAFNYAIVGFNNVDTKSLTGI